MLRIPWVAGIGYALAAVMVALCVILPVVFIVDRHYDGGEGLTRLVIVLPIAWFVLACLLARRRITL